MSQPFRLESLTPEMADWIAGNIVDCDQSVISTMLVSLDGNLLSSKLSMLGEADDLQNVEGVPLIVSPPDKGFAVFLRLQSPSAAKRVYSKVVSLVSSPATQA